MPTGAATGSPVLGLRAEVRQFSWAIVEGMRQSPKVHRSGKEEAPASYDEAAALSWFRARLLALISEYKPAVVALRAMEPMARAQKASARQRLRLEGVLMEAPQSQNVPILCGPLATISSKLHSKGAKAYLESGEFRGIHLKALPAPAREAVLVAAAALPE